MKRTQNKATRLLEIEKLLLAHPRGLRQVEIAQRLGVNRSTILRDLLDLSELPVPIYEDEGRICINREAYLTQIRLTLHESLAVHLAARLLAAHTDKKNPHAAAALRKLGLALEKLAPLISHHVLKTSEVMDQQAQYHDPVYQEVLETLTRAWAMGRKVRVWHQRLQDHRIFEYTFAPYFIEPYGWGHSIHTIGHREPPGALRTFKLERIKRIELLEETFTIPADFDPGTLLEHAWGIWYTDDEPVEVRLRFTPQGAQRLKENKWHPTEQIESLPDGGCIWMAEVAEVQEMVPWIRGWGADVEVLVPYDLREAMTHEARRLARLYGWTTHRGEQGTEATDYDNQRFQDIFGV